MYRTELSVLATGGTSYIAAATTTITLLTGRANYDDQLAWKLVIMTFRIHSRCSQHHSTDTVKTGYEIFFHFPFLNLNT